MVGRDGGVFAFGDAGFVGSLPGLGVHVNEHRGDRATSTGKGYWMVGRDGGVFAFGDAGFVGSLPGLQGPCEQHRGDGADATGRATGWSAPTARSSPWAPRITAGPSGRLPYWLGIVATNSGHGYWLVAANGRVFNFGDAASYGRPANNGPVVTNIVSIVPTQDGAGTWLIGNDGGVFTFGDATFAGSLPALGVHVNNIVGAVPTG